MTTSLEEPLTEAERKKLHKILDDPKAVDEVIDKALKGWREVAGLGRRRQGPHRTP